MAKPKKKSLEEQTKELFMEFKIKERADFGGGNLNTRRSIDTDYDGFDDVDAYRISDNES